MVPDSLQPEKLIKQGEGKPYLVSKAITNLVSTLWNEAKI